MYYDLRYEPVIVTHTCTLSYSVGSDWEDHDLRPDQGNICKTLSQPIKKAGHGSCYYFIKYIINTLSLYLSFFYTDESQVWPFNDVTEALHTLFVLL
jgi:hypothetical protein